MSVDGLKKIIYVEDEQDIQVIVKLCLENIGGFQVQIYSSGTEALTNVLEYMPDLILLDVMMPEMDGPTLFTHLQEMPQVKDIPVIFMTAKAQMHEVEEFKKVGVLDIITKPFDPMTLSQSIIDIWEKKHG